MHLLKNLVFAVFVSLLLASLTTAQAQDKRSSLLNKRAGNRNIFQKSTTTTTEANYEDEEYAEGGDAAAEDENQEEDQPASSTTTTTTEAAKKIGPSVRPFRSNQDLLSALKKRRLSEKNVKSSVTQKPVQEEKQYEQPEVKTTKAKPTSASSAGGNRRFGGHKSTNVKAPVQDNHAQTIEEPTSKPFKRSNRFSLRQNN